MSLSPFHLPLELKISVQNAKPKFFSPIIFLYNMKFFLQQTNTYRQPNNEANDNKARPVKQQHIEVVGRPAGKHSRLKTLRVVVQEIAVDEEVEARGWHYRVEEQSRH